MMLLKKDEELEQVATLVTRDEDGNFLEDIPLYRIKKRGTPDGNEEALRSFAKTLEKMYRKQMQAQFLQEAGACDKI